MLCNYGNCLDNDERFIKDKESAINSVIEWFDSNFKGFIRAYRLSRKSIEADFEKIVNMLVKDINREFDVSEYLTEIVQLVSMAYVEEFADDDCYDTYGAAGEQNEHGVYTDVVFWNLAPQCETLRDVICQKFIESAKKYALNVLDTGLPELLGDEDS